MASNLPLLNVSLSEETLEVLARKIASYMPTPAGPQEKHVLSMKEAARLTGLSQNTLYAEIRAGRLETLRVGQRRLVRASAVQDWLRARTEETKD